MYCLKKYGADVHVKCGKEPEQSFLDFQLVHNDVRLLQVMHSLGVRFSDNVHYFRYAEACWRFIVKLQQAKVSGQPIMPLLVEAVESGYDILVKEIIRDSNVTIDVNAPLYETGETLLHRAVINGQANVVRVLLNHRRTDASRKNLAGLTPGALALSLCKMPFLKQNELEQEESDEESDYPSDYNSYKKQKSVLQEFVNSTRKLYLIKYMRKTLPNITIPPDVIKILFKFM